MNETNSKYFDQLVIDKINKDKLNVVCHSPNNSLFKNTNISFSELEKCSLDISRVDFVNNEYFTFESFINTPYKENSNVYLYYYPAKYPAKGNILFVHGLFEENMLNYSFINILNALNFNVYFIILPYHFDRKPKESLFSGEFFYSADIYRLNSAFKQSILDIEYSVQLIKYNNTLPIMLVGYSIGGCTALRYSLLKQQPFKVFLINTTAKVSSLIWESPLLLKVGQDLIKSGFDLDIYESIINELDPCENIPLNFDNKKVVAVYGIYDQIINTDNYNIFIKKTGVSNVIPYSSGHLNALKVPRLTMDIKNFFQQEL